MSLQKQSPSYSTDTLWTVFIGTTFYPRKSPAEHCLQCVLWIFQSYSIKMFKSKCLEDHWTASETSSLTHFWYFVTFQSGADVRKSAGFSLISCFTMLLLALSCEWPKVCKIIFIYLQMCLKKYDKKTFSTQVYPYLVLPELSATYRGLPLRIQCFSCCHVTQV